jgi:hypothetical protein
MSNQVSFFDYSTVTKEPVFLEECQSPPQNKLFRDTIDKYHSYVKYKDSPTRNIRWLVYETVSGNHVGAIGLGSATIAIGCRDSYIGWNNETRLKNLGMLANNSRCCFIKENTTIKSLGSRVLKQLGIVGAKRWKEKYSQPLIMLETFVQPERAEELEGHKLRDGTIYRASNWIEVGKTSGNSIRKCPLLLWQKEKGTRGELSRKDPEAAMKKYGNYDGNQFTVTKSPIKIMFIKPLVWNWKKILLTNEETLLT